MPKNERIKLQPETDLFITDEDLTDISRRCELAMEFLSIMSEHETGYGDAEDTAEAISVFMATTAYLCVEFGIPELKVLSDLKRLHKKLTLAKSRLGPRSSARDMFTELALIEDSDIKTKSKTNQSKPVKKKTRK